MKTLNIILDAIAWIIVIAAIISMFYFVYVIYMIATIFTQFYWYEGVIMVLIIAFVLWRFFGRH